MLYYSVLNDIIRKPRSNKDLMNSIIQKAASIVREYGIDYVMEHNKDHFFDYDNNEIIHLSLEPIINKTATNVKNVSYREHIAFNYTSDMYSMVVEVELPESEENSRKTTGMFDLSELTNKQLVELNDQLIDCAETVRRDNTFLESMKEYIHKGEFFIVQNEDNYCGGGIHFVVGEPYIKSVGKVSAEMMRLNVTISSNNNVSFCGYDAHTQTFSIEDKVTYKRLSFNDAVDYFFKKCHKKNNSLNNGYHSGIINSTNKQIDKANEMIEQLNKDLENATDKKESLKIQLAIAEQEDEITALQKKIKSNEEDQANQSVKVSKVIEDIKSKLNELLIGKGYDIKQFT